MKKVFVVDEKIENNPNSFGNISISSIIDIIVLGIITLIFTVIWEVNLRYHSRFYIIIELVPMFYVFIKMIYRLLNSNFSKNVEASQTPYVILYDSKMLILSNVGVVDPTIALTFGEQLINGENLLKSLNNLGFTIVGCDGMNNVENNETDINEVMNVINSEVAGRYNIAIFENVSFVKETQNYYVFKGTLLDENGNSRAEQRFNLMKIYNNHEELKKVN